MYVEESSAKLGRGDACMIFEEFDKFVFVVKATLQGDLLDRISGVEQERLDVVQSVLDDERFGIGAEFAAQELGEVIGAVSKMLGNVHHR